MVLLNLPTNWWKWTPRLSLTTIVKRRCRTFLAHHAQLLFLRSAKWTSGRSESRTVWSPTRRSAPAEFQIGVLVAETPAELWSPRTTISRVGQPLGSSATSLATSSSGRNVDPISSQSSQKLASEYKVLMIQFRRDSYRSNFYISQVPWLDSRSVQPGPPSLVMWLESKWFFLVYVKLKCSGLLLPAIYDKINIHWKIQSTLFHCPHNPAFIVSITISSIVYLSTLTRKQMWNSSHIL